MATKIRLQRHGRKSYAFYSIVIADVRAPRDGKFIEKIGTYNPNTNPATVDLKFDRALYWVETGAQPTDTVRNILKGEGVYMMKHLRGGVKKGAFTDAKETQAGTFERANGGTLFLDEIGELPLDAQVKLLRVLEERKITRIGGKKAIPVNVRIVAATNRNLEEEVRLGKFRLDLLYRLNVFTIQLPPLRERKEDIPLLAAFFLRKHNSLLNLSIESITPEAMDQLCAYDWPGNVRDLENAVQSAMILCVDRQIHPGHLPARIKSYQMERLIAPQEAEEDTSLRDTNSLAEKARILSALQKHNYNRTLTAEALNISRKTLFNKMKRYNLGNE